MQEETKTQQTPQTSEPKIEDALEKAAALAKRIEEANKRSEEILARAILSGRATAGEIPKVESPEDKIKNEMKEYFKGTALEAYLKK